MSSQGSVWVYGEEGFSHPQTKIKKIGEWKALVGDCLYLY